MAATDTEERATKDATSGDGKRTGKRRKTDDGTTDVLVVPAKPALISAANLATLGGTAAWVAGGPVGVVAAAAVTGASVAVARRAARIRRQKRQAAAEAARRAAAGTPGGGAGGSAARGRSGGRPGTAGVARSGPGSGGGRAGRLASLFGANRRNGAGGGPASRAGGRGGSTGGGRSGPGGPTGGSRAGRFGRIFGGFTKRRGPGASRSPKGVTAGTARAVKGAAAGTYRGAKTAYRKARRWTRRNLFGKKPANTAGATKPCVKTTGPAPTVQQPPGTQPRRTGTPGKTPNRPAQPGPAVPVPGRVTARYSNPTAPAGGTTMGLLDEARRMYAYATTFEPRGMLGPVEAGGDFADMAEALGYVRATIGTYMERAAHRWPLDPAVGQVMGNVVALLNSASEGAREIKASIEAMHKKELERLRNQRPGEDKWDVTTNR